MTEKIAAAVDKARPTLEALPGVIVIHDIRSWHVVFMSEWGLRHLNITLEELQALGMQYHERFFDPEEVRDYAPRILGLLERNNNDEFISYFQRVRSRNGDDWELWHSATRIFLRGDGGDPSLTITTTMPIAADHNLYPKVDRLLEENIFLRKQYHLFSKLTHREKEVLRLMARDMSSAEMATSLSLSEDTIKTHRRNIKKKIDAANYYDVLRFAQAFDII